MYKEVFKIMKKIMLFVLLMFFVTLPFQAEARDVTINLSAGNLNWSIIDAAISNDAGQQVAQSGGTAENLINILTENVPSTVAMSSVIELPATRTITYVSGVSADENGSPIITTTTQSFSVYGLTVSSANSATTITSPSSERHFRVTTAPGALTLTGLTLQGISGGGGVDLSPGATVNFTDVSFKNNTAVDGGALSLKGAGITVSLNGTTTFEGNSATGNGGAIFIDAGTVNFLGGVTFAAGNTAAGNGGAIYNNGTVTFTSTSAFTSATAVSGGAIYNLGKMTFNAQPTFTSNTASSGEGGAIYSVANSETTFSNGATFVRNAAYGNGGAIYSGGRVNFNGTSNYSFDGNTSNNGNGGAIYYPEITGTVNLGSNYTFTDNIASADGGAIYYPGSLTVSGANFSGVSSKNATRGGAIYALGTVTVTSGTFTGNKASDLGGAIYSFNNSAQSVTISGGEFSQNEAKFGGVVFSAGGVDITDGTFTTNTADTGGVIYTSGDASISNGTFDGNTSTGTAGGVLYSVGTTTISNGTFSKNKADSTSGQGGVVFSTENVEISGGTIGDSAQNSNSASAGGAVYAAKQINISGGTFSYNKALGTTDGCYGGAVFASEDVTISGTPVFSNNSAVRHGGAIYTAGKVTLNGDVIFENNSTTSTSTNSKSHGGAIYAVGEVTGNGLCSPYFTSNISNYSGGAIYTMSNITLENVSFDSNVSNRDGGGGAVYTEKIAKFTNSIFTGNSAVETNNSSGGGRGGAIFADGSVTIESCTFGGNDSRQGNSAQRDGGAIHVQGEGSSTITKSVFKGDMATETNNSSGGAVYLDNSNPQHNFTITDTIFINNRAQAEGGALRIDGNNLLIMRCYFNNNQSNSAINGGAAYLAAARVVVVNSTFYNNSSSGGYGGAINLADIQDPGDETTSAALLMNTFVNNSCGSGRGGALYLTRNNGMEMFGNLLVGNEAPERSGKDVFVEQGKRIRSTGYNILTNIGVLSGGTPSTVTWKNTSFVIGNYDKDEVTENDVTYFFGDEITIDASSMTIGANDTETLYALHLNYGEGIENIALGFVLNDAAKTQFISKNINASDYTDALGILRPNSYNWDAGSRQLSNNVITPPDDPSYNTNQITAIKISGLPVTLRRVGQTASLVVYGLDAGGNIISRDMNVTWTYDDYFVKIDENNTIIALNLTTQEPGGYTTISATAYTPGGERTDSKRIRITESRSTGRYSNVSEKYLEEIGEFNASVSDASVAIGESASNNATVELVQASAFQTSFQKSFPGAAQSVQQVDVSDDVFELDSENLTYKDSDDFRAVKDGIDLMLNGRNKGDILPVEYSWIYTRSELQNLLGTSYTSANLNNPETFEKILRIAFKTDGGNYTSVIGSNAVALKDAFNSKALSIDTDDENNQGGAVIRFTAYLANIAYTKNSQLVSSTAGNKLLVVPDGLDNDSRISGTMFILQKSLSGNQNQNQNQDNSNQDNSSETGSKSSGSGGGGGCNSFASLSCLLVLAFSIRKNKH